MKLVAFSSRTLVHRRIDRSEIVYFVADNHDAVHGRIDRSETAALGETLKVTVHGRIDRSETNRPRIRGVL